MKPALFTIYVSICLFIAAPVSRADIIVMKSGQRIEGEVLKVQKDTVFVDVGVDVIRIPVTQIQERISQEPAKTEGRCPCLINAA